MTPAFLYPVQHIVEEMVKTDIEEIGHVLFACAGIVLARQGGQFVPLKVALPPLRWEIILTVSSERATLAPLPFFLKKIPVVCFNNRAVTFDLHVY